MKEEDRRSLLRTFTDDEYRDVINVCARLPDVSMEVSSKGKNIKELGCYRIYYHSDCMSLYNCNLKD